MLNTRYHCMLLNSGGYDSTVLLKYLHYFGYDTWSLTFDYGQPTKEIDYAVKNARAEGIPENQILVQQIPMDWCVKEALDERTVAGVVGYVPMRNTIFLSYALSLAETYELNAIAIGILGCGTFADNNPFFIEDFRPVAQNIGVDVLSPLDQLEKKNVYELGNIFGVKIEDTWSCNTPRKNILPMGQSKLVRCGLCSDCVALKEALWNGQIKTEEDIKFDR